MRSQKRTRLYSIAIEMSRYRGSENLCPISVMLNLFQHLDPRHECFGILKQVQNDTERGLHSQTLTLTLLAVCDIPSLVLSCYKV